MATVKFIQRNSCGKKKPLQTCKGQWRMSGPYTCALLKLGKVKVGCLRERWGGSVCACARHYKDIKKSGVRTRGLSGKSKHRQ